MFQRKKEIAAIFQTFNDRDFYTVIRDFFELAAISLRNAVDIRNRATYEERYAQIASGYSDTHRQKFATALGILMDAIYAAAAGDAPFCDWCGELFMESGTSNSRMGQFFTPYTVSKVTAQGIISEKDVRAKIGDGNGVFTISDSACGAGGLIVAAIEKLRTMGINYAHNVFVDCGDIDSRCVHMTYLTLSILGVPAVVRLGDALKLEYREAWFTPAYIFNCAHFLRQIGCGTYPYTATVPKSAAKLQTKEPTPTTPPTNEPPTPTPTKPNRPAPIPPPRVEKDGQYLLFA